jgi:hypothetical protein
VSVLGNWISYRGGERYRVGHRDRIMSIASNWDRYQDECSGQWRHNIERIGGSRYVVLIARRWMT